MDFNPSKCVVLQITRSKKVINYNYTLHGQTLEPVSDARYLGVDRRTDLSWSRHIQRVSTKAINTLGFLRRNITTKHQGIRETAYKTMVRAQVEYASTVWCPHTQDNIRKVEMVQRRAVRWVKNNNSPYASVTEMQDSLGWSSLEQRRAEARLAMFFKIVHGLVAIPIPSYLEPPRRATRHTHQHTFRQIHTTANLYKFTFFPATVILWNSLPHYMVTLPDLPTFKQAVGRTKLPKFLP